jgi:hypothetical protein
MPGTRTRITATAFLGVLFLSTTGFAAAPKLIDKYRETILENKEVAGNFEYVLAMMAGNELEAPGRSMTVWLPPESGQRLCMTIRSIDAQFEAVGVYDVSETEAGQYRLNFVPTPKSGKLYSSYGAGELVLDARVGDNCDEKTHLVRILASWGNSNETDSLGFYVNSGEHDGHVIIPSLGDLNKLNNFECRLVGTERSRVAFHSHCGVGDTSVLDISQAWFEIWRFDTPIDSQILNIVLPPDSSSDAD